MLNQRTIRDVVTTIGIGVHSGKKVRMTLRPARPNTGIHFVRTDLKGTPAVKASVTNVVDTTLATTVGSDTVRVSTVEHLMAAMWGAGIDNLVVELNGAEVPSLDGSAAPFIYLVNRAQVVEQRSPKQFIRIRKTLQVTDGHARLKLTPFAGFKGSYNFVYDHPVYNRYPKFVEVDFSQQSFVADVSRARSFGLIGELEQAQAINRCLGSSLENSVGIDDYIILNQDGLRYQDEFVKHKLLDLVGDMYLLGHPLLGQVEGHMSGHSLNNLLGKTLLENRDAWEFVNAPALPASETPAWPLDWGTSPDRLAPAFASAGN